MIKNVNMKFPKKYIYNRVDLNNYLILFYKSITFEKILNQLIDFF